MVPTPPSRCSPATTSASAPARTRRKTASPSAAACRIAANRSTSRCRSTTPCAAAWSSRSFPGTANEFRLMSVHLKSGCPAGPLTAPGRNCELLSKQVAPLEAWIEGEARAGHRFGVLGDFNRRFTIEKGPARDAEGRQLNVYKEIDDGDPPASKLTQHHGAGEVHALHDGQRIPRIHRQHPAGPRSREERAEEIVRARGVQRPGCEDALAVGSLPGGHRAPSALTSIHTRR